MGKPSVSDVIYLDDSEDESPKQPSRLPSTSSTRGGMSGKKPLPNSGAQSSTGAPRMAKGSTGVPTMPFDRPIKPLPQSGKKLGHPTSSAIPVTPAWTPRHRPRSAADTASSRHVRQNVNHNAHHDLIAQSVPLKAPHTLVPSVGPQVASSVTPLKRGLALRNPNIPVSSATTTDVDLGASQDAVVSHRTMVKGTAEHWHPVSSQEVSRLKSVYNDNRWIFEALAPAVVGDDAAFTNFPLATANREAVIKAYDALFPNFLVRQPERQKFVSVEPGSIMFVETKVRAVLGEEAGNQFHKARELIREHCQREYLDPDYFYLKLKDEAVVQRVEAAGFQIELAPPAEDERVRLLFKPDSPFPKTCSKIEALSHELYCLFRHAKVNPRDCEPSMMSPKYKAIELTLEPIFREENILQSLEKFPHKLMVRKFMPPNAELGKESLNDIIFHQALALYHPGGGKGSKESPNDYTCKRFSCADDGKERHPLRFFENTVYADKGPLSSLQTLVSFEKRLRAQADEESKSSSPAHALPMLSEESQDMMQCDWSKVYQVQQQEKTQSLPITHALNRFEKHVVDTLDPYILKLVSDRQRERLHGLMASKEEREDPHYYTGANYNCMPMYATQADRVSAWESQHFVVRPIGPAQQAAELARLAKKFQRAQAGRIFLGMRALTFQNPADYDKISGSDKISILGLKDFAPGKPLDVEITHKDGSKDKIQVNHSFNAGQIEFFKAGSALNLMAAAAKKRDAQQ
ncbi:hypothetical protein NliqN6_3723 [Naganishia liquefaciens]|uniref:Uncharacterized protein n=1 Tax=Naganishia liquefaciens TaxID=104408 RepID=A0A8H3TUS8_9TREE|nr:hypothetical protein NliqN6_3723 [Naganishia liquefaciens]